MTATSVMSTGVASFTVSLHYTEKKDLHHKEKNWSWCAAKEPKIRPHSLKEANIVFGRQSLWA
jgi:hypothetical protein